jgi:integrase
LADHDTGEVRVAKKQAAGAMKRVAEGIYRRGDAYLVPIYNAESKSKDWHSAGCGTRCGHVAIVDLATAREAKRQLEQRKRLRRRHGGADKTVGEWMTSESGGTPPLWLQLYPRLGAGTMIHTAERVRAFARKFEDRTLRSLTEEEVWEWCSDHPSSVKELRACFNDAIRAKLMTSNPLEHYRQGKGRGRRDISTLKVAELDDLLLPTAREVWRDYGPTMEAIIEVGAWTGMRPGELFLLSTQPGNDANGGRVNYVDFDSNVIHVEWQWNVKIREIARPKWGSRRKVVLLPRARAAIEQLPKTPEGWCFVTQRMARFTQRNLHYYWDPVRRAFADRLPASHWLRLRMAEDGQAGDLDFYELRHFFGTALAHPPAGIRPATPYEIAQQMGHKDGGQLAMRIYIHTDGDDVVAGLSDAWAQHAPRRQRGVA